MMPRMNIVLSGAITGHVAEAREYFRLAKLAVLERYPLANIFDPTTLPESLGWESCMIICRARISNWATHIVYIENEYYNVSRGSKEERELAVKKGVVELRIRDKIVLDEVQ